jgi:hypothetical protein
MRELKNATCIFLLWMPIVMLLTGLPNRVASQDFLFCDGNVHTISYNGSYQDFVIPDDPSLTQLEFTAKGGDGGFAELSDNCRSEGGQGATLTAVFNVGTGPDALLPGSTLRFIVGEAGEKGTGGSVIGTGFTYGGGGGGTGILYKAAGSDVWIVLAAAGGGGGAYQGRIVGFCVDSQPGQGGRAGINGGNGNGGVTPGSGGSAGQGGQGGAEISGGGGGAFSAGSGVACVGFGGASGVGEGQAGFFEGGAGGGSEGCVSFTFRNGGFGFGGGGAGIGGGGGGGGYSGGGGGGTAGRGGGGGSYVIATNAGQNITAGEITTVVENGFVQYKCNMRTGPTAQCIAASVTLSLDGQGSASIDPSMIDGGSSDPSGGTVALSLDQETFDCASIGDNVVTLTVTDEIGMTDQCSATVIIVDDSPPTLSCPPALNTVNDPQECGAIINFEDQISWADNCGATLTASHNSGDFFAAGQTEVTVKATDPSGNEASCTFLVTVADTEAPKVTCPGDIEVACEEDAVPDPAGGASVVDNCDNVVSLSFFDDIIDGNCAWACTIERTWTAEDAEGNTGNCVQTIKLNPGLRIEDAFNLDGSAAPIVLGFSSKRLIIDPGAVECVLQWLPGSETPGAPAGLPNGNYTIDGSDCSQYPIQVDGEGRLTNPMLTQGLLLAIHLRLDPALATMPLSATECEIDPIVLQTLSPNATFGELMNVTNYALANLVLVPFRNQFTAALSCINSRLSLCTPFESAIQPLAAGSLPVDAAGFSTRNPAELTSEGGNIGIYPNPVVEEAWIDLSAFAGQAAVIRVFNLQGQLVDELRIQELAETPLRLDVSSFAKGMYLIAADIAGNGIKMGKLVR